MEDGCKSGDWIRAHTCTNTGSTPRAKSLPPLPPTSISFLNSGCAHGLLPPVICCILSRSTVCSIVLSSTIWRPENLFRFYINNVYTVQASLNKFQAENYLDFLLYIPKDFLSSKEVYKTCFISLLRKIFKVIMNIKLMKRKENL